MTCGALTTLGMEIKRIEGRLIGDDAEVASEAVHGVQHCVDVDGQATAEFRDHSEFLGDSLAVFLPKEDDFTQRNAEHHIGIFEVFGMRIEERGSSFWQK